MPKIEHRKFPEPAYQALLEHGVHPLLSRIYAARGIAAPRELETELAGLLPFEQLKGVREAAALLADAIAAHKRLLIVADYDADGATACAVGVRALRGFGATVDYLVPNRFEYGYGLTPEIVKLAAQTKQPDLLITVDNGIASVEGVAEANRLGIPVLITDHHLPGDELPQALAIVNPNQPGCGFPSKNLAGVGVMFYLMLALRSALRQRGAFRTSGTPGGGGEPNLAQLLDIVALGTVADVVRLDANNRTLVAQGLKRIRAGRACPGINALLRGAARDSRRVAAHDLGFAVGPRLNAAGRLDDMALGIECLLADDETRAQQIAAQLDALNRERRAIEAGMQQSAEAALANIAVQDGYSLSLFDAGWHQGVIGILASRLKDRLHRPVIVFARGAEGELKGSGRSIAGLHLRDALDLVAKRHPGLLLRFGGHAAAAGLAIREGDFARFAAAFEDTGRELLSPADLEQVIETDGTLAAEHCTMAMAQQLDDQVWGQGFPLPTFCDVFEVAQQRVVGEKHLKLKLTRDALQFDAILFSHPAPLPEKICAVYRIGINEFNGASSLQLTLTHWERWEPS
ncbi:MAG: single-stranded-DNA-specific exonuclease RecJ [Pseudomonadota bacterium]